MKSSIYISSEKIEIIGYTKSVNGVSVKQYETCPLPEGTMINGKIIDTSSLTECFSGMRKKFPRLFSNPTLIVDGSSILTKRMVVPKLKKWQFERYIRDELADTSEKPEELVCDHHRIGKTDASATAIMACAAEIPQVESYISTHKSAGIKLRAIRIGVQAILGFVASKPELQKRTFVLNVIDGVSLLSVVFDNGENVFMSRSRLYCENYEQLVQDLQSSLSGLIQFNRSQKFNDITHSYYLGMKEEDLVFMNEVNPHAEVRLELLNIVGGADKKGVLAPDSHFVFLNTLLGDNSIDLMRSIRTLEKLKRRQRPKKLWIPTLVALLLLLAAPVAYMWREESRLNAEVSELSNYFEDSAVIEKSAELDAVISKTVYYSDIINQINMKMETEREMSAISERALELVINQYSGMATISQFDFDENTGILRLSGKCANGADASKYVDALKKSDLIRDVKYNGYSHGSGGEYFFSIDVSLDNGEAAK